jgi:predicted MFS family arabinose efflux permease
MTDHTPTNAPLPKATVRLFSLIGAMVVANLYYNQPLLPLIATTFGVSASASGVIPALTQAGYATGLFFLVPLADFLNPRRLLCSIVAIVAVALAIGGLAPSIVWLQAMSFVIGVFSVVPQILLPLAASMSLPNERGRTIGTIMAGLLTGVLLSRTVSGVLAHWFGWRVMYEGGAALMLVALVMIVAIVPKRDVSEPFRYGEVLRSLLHLARTEPILQETSLIGAMAFGAFSAFWSTLAFFLVAPPWRLSSDAAGWFGLVGVAGVAAAPLVGRLADRRSPRMTAAAALAIMLASFGVFAIGRHSLLALVAGVLLLDLGVQSALVSNQARFYAISATAASRLNTVFMTSYFLGGALGSVLAAHAFLRYGWSGTCAVGAAMLLLALLPYAVSLTRRRA